MQKIKLFATTDASGDGTVTADKAVTGKIEAVQWVDGDLVDSNTAVLSVIDSGHTQTILTVGAGEGDADKWYYPRVATCDAACTALTDYARMIAVGRLQLVVAAGGATKTGGCYVWID